MYVFTIFSLCIPLIDGHLVCFHKLAIISTAAMNTGVHVSFQISVLIFGGDIHPRVELLDGMEVPFLVFEDPSYCFPQWLQ